MAEALLPEAAGLVVDVHEGSADDIKTRLMGLSRHELEALAVLLAALADPDRGIRESLAWVDFDENGNRLYSSDLTRSQKAVRDLAPSIRRELAGVDVVAVHRALTPEGQGVPLTQAERRLAIEVGYRRGLPKKVIADRLGMSEDAVDRTWDRIKKRARDAGGPVPVRGQVMPVAS
jgi:DNA-binding CsgD family transcriptional regulator